MLVETLFLIAMVAAPPAPEIHYDDKAEMCAITLPVAPVIPVSKSRCERECWDAYRICDWNCMLGAGCEPEDCAWWHSSPTPGCDCHVYEDCRVVTCVATLESCLSTCTCQQPYNCNELPWIAPPT